MTNEQYSNMMLEFAKLEAKIEKLEQQMVVTNAYIDTQLKEKYYPTSVENKVEILPEHLSNFWNEEGVKRFNRPLSFHSFHPDVLIVEGKE